MNSNMEKWGTLSYEGGVLLGTAIFESKATVPVMRRISAYFAVVAVMYYANYRVNGGSDASE